MKLVEPKVHFIKDVKGIETYLASKNIDWRPDLYLSFPEALMEFAGRLCYESWTSDGSFENKNLTKIREGNKDYLGNIIKQGHLSVFEHGGPLVFLFSNVSRIFTHELVRHRAGCSYSQTSGRYVRGNDIKFWIPPSLEEAKEEICDIITLIESQYQRLERIIGVDKAKDFSEKKKLTSALRRILPNGQANNILMSCNHRAMRHIINMRTSAGAEEEIRLIFDEVARICKNYYPNIYQDMEKQEDGSWQFNSG